MTTAELTIIKKDGSHETLHLKEQDDIEANEGGFGVTFATSPSITTFYPYHRIWEYQEFDPSKAKKLMHPEDDNEDPSLDY